MILAIIIVAVCAAIFSIASAIYMERPRHTIDDHDRNIWRRYLEQHDQENTP